MTLKTLCAAVLVLAGPLAAQDRDTTRAAPSDSQNVTLLDITVDPNVNEPHTIFLAKHIVYKASFSEPGVTIRMRSFGNKQLPFVVPLANGPDAGGGAEFELYPQADGEVQFTAIFNEDQRPVRFKIWSDVRATHRGEASAAEGFWELGFDALAGWHGAFDRQEGGPAGASATVGACLSVRNGPGPVGFFNGCIVGAEKKLSGTPGVFFFTQPQIRLNDGRRTDTGWRNELGLVLRYGFFADGSDGNNFGAGSFGWGAYFARDQRDPDGKGWRLLVLGRMDGTPGETVDAFGTVTEHSRHWSPSYQLGIGRYF